MVELDLRLDGRVVVLTGASRRRSIGTAICRTLAAQGADIVFTHWQAYDRTTALGADEEGPRALEQKLRALGVRAEAVEVDLAAPDAAAFLLDVAAERLGPPSILVNSAAHAVNAGYETLDAALLDAHYAVNMRALILLSVEFTRRYPGGVGGRIINLTSGQSLKPMPDELPYAATKGAVEAFTTSLAAGVAAKGITVNAVDPGGTDTGWMSEDLRARLLLGSAFGRVGQPEDAARLVAFLASDAGAWITGQIIHSRGA